MAGLETIWTNLVAALAAGCDDLHQCATSDCCPAAVRRDRHPRGDAMSANVKHRHQYGDGTTANALLLRSTEPALLVTVGAGVASAMATI